MRIIDAHMHFSNIGSFIETANLISEVDYSYDGLIKEYGKCGVEAAICMGITETEKYRFPDDRAESPMTADLCPGSHIFIQNPLTTGNDTQVGVYLCPGINPHRLGNKNIASLNAMAKAKKITGIKIYAGYYHLHMYDKAYEPVYHIAAEQGIPVVIHTGDTYSENGLLEFSHPLNADKLAAKYRDINFILAHMGDPWIMDACEVAYKNKNIYLDMSGLIVGNKNNFAEVENSELLMNRFKTGILFLNNYEKLLFGTDWPLAPVGEYISLCKKLIPPSAYDNVFFNNAYGLFNLELT